MRLTVLGNSSRYLAPLGAGVSYLLEAGDARILLDAGHGTQLKLSALGERGRLDAVVVSHFHLDSVMDLLPVMGALDPGAPLFLPEGAEEQLVGLERSVRVPETSVEHVDVRTVKPGAEELVAGVRLRFGESRHGCPCVSVRAEHGGTSLAYLADTGPLEALAELARDVDLVVAHTLILDRQAGQAFGAHNLSAGEAGRIARAAGARRLALSHVPFYRHPERSLAEAHDAFGGEVVVLEEDAAYTV